jgi:hypothetical protein
MIAQLLCHRHDTYNVVFGPLLFFYQSASFDYSVAEYQGAACTMVAAAILTFHPGYVNVLRLIEGLLLLQEKVRSSNNRSPLCRVFSCDVTCPPDSCSVAR